MLRPFVILAAAGLVAACRPNTGPSAPAATIRLDAEQRLRADRLVSVFENGSIELQYDYVENLGDGRGYTVGRGFCTRTGDALRVVERYVSASPGDPIERFLPELRRLAAERSSDVSELRGFVDAWKASAKLSSFRAAEDAEVEQSSYVPATRHADALGLRTAIGLAILYDSVVMHGDGEDDDSVPALVARTDAVVGGAPMAGVDERKWLGRFLEVRRADLANSHDPATRTEWAQAVGRVDALAAILASGNDDLHGPIHVGSGYDVDVP